MKTLTKVLLVVVSLIEQIKAQSSDALPSRNQPAQSRAGCATIPATCKHRTINYVTDILPQQCLASVRRPSHGRPYTTSSTPSATRISDEAGSAPPAVEGSSQSNVSPSHEQSSSSSLVPVSTQTPQVPDSSVSVSSSSSTDSASNIPPSSTTATVTKQDETAAARDALEAETDSPLDNANFLSFEEWKKQNLAKSGQVPADDRPRSRSINVNHNQHGLESLGEEAEIDIDFSGFGAAQHVAKDMTRSPSVPPAASSSHANSALVQPTSDHATGDVASISSARSKDAGRTCKERTNYASLDCAATIIKSNKECKSSSSVLIENKDSYMLNVCSAPNKYIILEMCDDILIDTVVLANYEFFSSIFRGFRVSVSDRYPPKGDNWRNLGVFEARNTRQVQAFLVEQPLIWARFVKIDFLTHYGNEYYCPVSLLRIHGTTMLEEFKHQDEPQQIPQEPATASTAADESVAPVTSVALTPTSTEDRRSHATLYANDKCPRGAQQAEVTMTWARCAAKTSSESFTVITASSSTEHSTSATEPSSSLSVKDGVQSGAPVSSSANTQHNSESVSGVSPVKSPTESASSTNSTEHPRVSGQSSGRVNVAHNQTSSASAPVASSDGSVTQSLAASPSKNVPSVVPSPPIPPPPPPPPPPPAPPPTTQESFYKSVQKRLQMLESNATLSLQYIEEQSRILRDAFSKVEKRQVNRTENFLRELNRTVLTELAGFRTQYDHLWQSTVIELETHREQYQREILAVSSRLNMVAEELLFQKRMVVIQSTLLILCLGLVIFARVGTTGLNLEVPLIQQDLAKSSLYNSQHNRYTSSQYASGGGGIGGGANSPPPNSPPAHDAPSPSSWRHSWGYWGRQSPTSPTGGQDSPVAGNATPTMPMQMTYQPPTPMSAAEGLPDSARRDEYNDKLGHGSAMASVICMQGLETQSSPSTPTGTREPTKTTIVDGA